MCGYDLRQKVRDLVGTWKKDGLPGRDGLVQTARELAAWKQASGQASLWPSAPVLATATLDDAWGHGLEIIELYAELAGIQVIRLGLLMSPEAIVSICAGMLPDYLGMTVLQLDSEDDLICIGKSLPQKTGLIVGGPVFKARPDIARTAGVRFMAKNVAAFLEFLLSIS